MAQFRFWGNQAMKSKISIAVAAILGGTSFASYAAEPATDKDTADAGTLEEVVVTATRRSESMQDVPISMQAFTAQTLTELNVATFDDYIKFLPNVLRVRARTTPPLRRGRAAPAFLWCAYEYVYTGRCMSTHIAPDAMQSCTNNPPTACTASATLRK